jgi:hypothetical protein
MAQIADKYTLVPSLYHTAAAVHDTGHQPANRTPVSGGIVSPNLALCWLGRGQELSSACAFAGHWQPGGIAAWTGAGFLGKTYDPFIERRSGRSQLQSPGHAATEPISALRRTGGTWRKLIDESVKNFESTPDARLFDSTFNQAYGLMSSTKQRAFELEQEDDKIRAIRKESFRPELPAGQAPHPGRSPLRDGEHV